VRSSIECVTEQQITNVNWTTRLFGTNLHLLDQDVYMLFKNVEITDTIFDKLWSDELSGCMPLVKIGGED